jgi:hypothetical protein
MLRLLNLRGALLKHRLPLSEIIDILIGKYRKGKGSEGSRLGIAIKVLTGPAAMKYLDEQVRKTYPNQEQMKSWRSRKIQLINSVRFRAEPSGNFEDFPEKYLGAISDHREESARILDKRRRRRYRNSPWV